MAISQKDVLYDPDESVTRDQLQREFDILNSEFEKYQRVKTDLSKFYRSSAYDNVNSGNYS